MNKELCKQLAEADNLLVEALYKKAVLLLEHITDEELTTLFAKYPELFISITGPEQVEYLHDINTLEEVIELFLETIEDREVSEDEFEAMTMDEIKDILCANLTDKNETLFNLLKEIW